MIGAIDEARSLLQHDLQRRLLVRSWMDWRRVVNIELILDLLVFAPTYVVVPIVSIRLRLGRWLVILRHLLLTIAHNRAKHIRTRNVTLPELFEPRL